MLKVSPRKGVIRFRKQGKLNPRYIRPFKILERIGLVAYKLELPEEISNVHSTFHISNLKKCLSDESLVVPMKELRLDDKLNFVEEPVEVMDPEDEEYSFGDDADDTVKEEAFKDEDEKEEHLDPIDSSAISINDHVPLAEETEPFKTNESAPTQLSPKLRSARISIKLSPPMAISMKAYIVEAVGIRLRVASPLPSLAPSSPLLLPATGRREDVHEADVPPQKRLCLTAPTPRFEIGESSTIEIAMAVVRVVNLRVSYPADVHRRESEESYTRHQDAHYDRATVRAKIGVLRREWLAYERERERERERESSETRQALARSEAYNRALKVQIATIETQPYRIECQRQDADDHVTRAMMRIPNLDDKAHINTLEDIGNSA
nr:putative reverse transcriptase domain-containing protein [Tanacetum cinerariifolium]